MTSLKNKKTFYILDDDPEFALQLKELLSDLGESKIFYNVESFISAFANQAPSLCIIDIHLGQGVPDGYAAITSIKKFRDAFRTPILVLSGDQSSETIKKVFKAGIDDFILKPVMPQLFVEKVEHLLFNSKQKLNTNSLTGLPGIYLIEEEYNNYISKKQPFCVAYIDLDNFKPFNDCKGVKAGDKAIELLAQKLLSLHKSYSKEELFTAHLGGDDFFILGNLQKVHSAIRHIYDSFHEINRELYSQEEITNSKYLSITRQGEQSEFPLLTVSTAILILESDFDFNFHDISLHAAHLKKKAKKQIGNSIATAILKKRKKSLKGKETFQFFDDAEFIDDDSNSLSKEFSA